MWIHLSGARRRQMRRSCRPGWSSTSSPRATRRPHSRRFSPAARAIAANSFISPNKLYQTKRACPAPCICSPSCSRCSWPRRLTLARVLSPFLHAKEKTRCNRGALRFPVHSSFAVCIPMPAGKLIMTHKRKRDDDSASRLKRQRRRKRSHSDPLTNDSKSAEKRQALKRLFGRVCSVEIDENLRVPEEESDLEDRYFLDENDDPLLDSVPVDMDPEQLGFLVCAQETLRFLHGRGIPPQHPVFARLRSRLLQGIDEIATA